MTFLICWFCIFRGLYSINQVNKINLLTSRRNAVIFSSVAPSFRKLVRTDVSPLTKCYRLRFRALNITIKRSPDTLYGIPDTYDTYYALDWINNNEFTSATLDVRDTYEASYDLWRNSTNWSCTTRTSTRTYSTILKIRKRWIIKYLIFENSFSKLEKLERDAIRTNKWNDIRLNK